MENQQLSKLIKKEYRGGGIYHYESLDGGFTWKYMGRTSASGDSLQEEQRHEMSRIQRELK